MTKKWKWNYRDFNFIFEEAFRVMRMRNELFSIFDQLYFMTDVLSGDGKGDIFSHI